MSLATPEALAVRGRRPEATNGYRALLRFEVTDDAFDHVLDQVGSWLRHKDLDVDPRTSRYVEQGRARLLLVNQTSKAGSSLLLTLTEDTPQGIWVTELVAHVPAGKRARHDKGWLRLRVTNSRGRRPAVPRLATYLLDVLEVSDGAMPLYSRAPVVNVTGVPDLLEALTDHERVGLLFVAGSDHQLELGAWTEQVRRWTTEIRGTAQAVVLDPAATAEFNARVGRSHQVTPWTIRTYRPGADPEWSADSRFHRTLGTQRLAERTETQLRGFFSHLARSHVATHVTPGEVTRTLRRLSRLADEVVVDALFTSTTPDEVDAAPTPQGSTVASRPRPVVAPAPPPGLATQRGRGLTPEDPSTEPDPHPQPDPEPGPEPEALPKPQPGPEPATEPEEGRLPEVETSTGVRLLAQRTRTQSELLEQVAAALGIPMLTGPEDVTAALAQRDHEIAQELSQAQARAEAAAKEAAQLRAARDQERGQVAPAPDLSRIQAELGRRTEKIAELSGEVELYRELFEDEELLRVLAEQERSRAEDESRWLRGELRRHGDWDSAVAGLPDEGLTEYPDSFEDLLGRLDELEKCGVVVTADHSTVRSLDDVDGSGKLVRAGWESLLVLADYLTARGAGDHDGSLESYLNATPSGYRQMSPKKHAASESESTMNRYGHLRVMPVPVEVDPRGEICMAAHFKLGSLGMVSPRLHYADDFHGTAKVYVGYIGPHLRTVSTN